ncbi:hypothetical protein [Echinicola shivajiensis]|uniref:hypothetical protein n=1 Tax=Echinicola shivajiensis TaxID=1035916 RepID=UPI001BFBF71A|nr:hypothetical protein [Echinicola shivajiensis]
MAVNHNLITLNQFNLTENKFNPRNTHQIGFSDEVFAHFKGKEILFENVTFVNELKFEFKDTTIKFNQCRFNKGFNFIGDKNKVVFNDCTYSLKINNIKEINSEFKFYFTEINGKNREVISFDKFIYSKSILVDVKKSVAISSISDGVNEFVISGNNKNYFIDLISFECENSPNIKFNGCHIGRVEFKYKKYNDICIEDCVFRSDNLAGIVNPNKDRDLALRVSGINSFKSSKSTFENVYFFFKDKTTVESISFAESKFNELSIGQEGKGGKCDLVTVNKLNIENDCTFDLQQNTYNSLVLKNKFTKEINIEGATIGNLTFDNFSTTEEFTFKDVDVIKKSKLIIYKSLFNKVIINPSFLHRFNSIENFQSKFNGINIVSFEKVKGRYIESKSDYNSVLGKKKYRLDRIDFVRFLKKLADEEGDLNLFQKYRALEYNYTLREYKGVNLFEWFNLLFNCITNNHTTSWFRALGCISVLILAYFYFLSSHLIGTNQITDYDLIYQNAYIFISPVKYLNTLNGYVFPSWYYVIDVVYKFFIGALFFQMIAAFRKFHK